MSTTSTHTRRRFGLLLAALLGALWSFVGGAVAQTPPDAAPDIVVARGLTLPPLPETYLVEHRGAVTWAFPARTSDETHALQATYDEVWPRLVDELGGEVPATTEIRLATSPEQMRALAPIGAPPPAYATGVTYPGASLILLSFTAPETWERPAMDKLLAHELSHLALHHAVGDASLPRWFVEGLAVQQSGEQSLARIQRLWDAVVGGSLIPLSRLSASFPARTHDVSLAYAQSASLVGFLRNDDARRRKFERLVHQLREGRTFSAALFDTYYMRPGDLEREWRASVSERFTALPLIATGSGVWGLAMVLAVAAWARRRKKHRQTIARWAVEEAATRAAVVAEAERRALEALRWSDAVAATETLAIFSEERDLEVPTVRHAGRDHTIH